MIIIDPTMKSAPSTATALASNRRKLRLAGRTVSPYTQPHDNTTSHRHQQQRNDHAEHASSPSSTSTLSPAARRRLNRAHQQSSDSAKEAHRRQPQHLDQYHDNEQHQPQQQPSQRDQSLSQLNLHCTESADSDDNGTCFNSIGTNTPRHPPSNSSPRKHNHRVEHQQDHLHHQEREEKQWHHHRRKLSPLAEQTSPPPRNDKRFFARDSSPWDTNDPTTTSTTNRNIHTRYDNNSYSEFEHCSIDDSHHPPPSSSYATSHNRNVNKNNRQRGRSRTTRYNNQNNVYDTPSVNSTGMSSTLDNPSDSYHNFTPKNREKNSTNGLNHQRIVIDQGEEEELVEDFLNKPHVKAAIGVGAAATLCAAILGPIGLLVGAASAGIGMGVLQIPEEQRNNVCNHVATSLSKARDVALELSDTVSTSCGKCANNENPVEAASEVRREFFDKCCSGVLEEKKRGVEDDNGSLAWRDDTNVNHTQTKEIKPAGSSPMAAALNHSVHNVKGLVGEVMFGNEMDNVPYSSSQTRDSTVLSSEEESMPRVACCRKGRVVPLAQIHSLRPSLQPRAWLDVMASAHTSREEKNEAMEEILILAKDKDISRWFLEEGILDSLMYILSNYFRNYSAFLRNEPPVNETREPFQSFKPGSNAFFHARLAANCCVALGKAHCAAVHTEGDLLLMSAYSRGSVPIERQLAQMLFEVPYHMNVNNPIQPNLIGGPNNKDGMHDHVEFTLTELSMQQAEDLASSIKSLDDGNIDI
ncbi:hypothetical protein ACHAXN_001213 [Cyclotella atomus]